MSPVIFWVCVLILAAIVYVMTPTTEQRIERDAKALYDTASAEGTLDSVVDRMLDPMNKLTAYDLRVIEAFEKLLSENE